MPLFIRIGLSILLGGICYALPAQEISSFKGKRVFDLSGGISLNTASIATCPAPTTGLLPGLFRDRQAYRCGVFRSPFHLSTPNRIVLFASRLIVSVHLHAGNGSPCMAGIEISVFQNIPWAAGNFWVEELKQPENSGWERFTDSLCAL